MKQKSAHCLVRAGSRLFAIAIVALLAAPSGRATPTNVYYWDTNGSVPGAGTTAGDWGTGTFWSLDSTGLSSTATETTLATDDVYFSAGTTGTGGGNPQVTLTAAQDIGNIFLNYRPDLVLSSFRIFGSTINLYSGINYQAIGASIGGYNYESEIASAITLMGAATLQNNSPLTFFTSGAITGANDLTIQNNSSNNLGMKIGGGVTLSGTAKIINNGTGSGIAYLSGTVSGTNGGIVQDSPTSVLYVGGSNNFVGNIELKRGLLIEGSSNNGNDISSLGNAANQILFNGGILGYMTRTNGSIDLSSRFSSTSTGDYKIDIPVSGSTYATSLSRTGVGLHKYGQGSLTLSAAAAYDGKTTIGGIDVVNRQLFGGGILQIGNGAATANLGSLNGPLGTDLEFKGTGTFNVAEAPGVHQGMKALVFTDGDGTVKSTYAGTVGTDTSALSFSSYSRAAGATANFVVTQATGGVNGTTNKITLGGMATDSLIDGAFFNGGATGGASYAWYDAAGFVRGINYGSDFLTYTTGATTTLSAGNGDHQQATGSISAQASDTFTSLNIRNTSSSNIPTVANQVFTLAAGATVTTDQVLVSGGAGTGAIVTISGGTGIRPNFDSDFVVRADLANDRLIISDFVKNGTNALAKSGVGTLVLAGANTIGGNGITGNISINDGALLINTSADTTYTGHVSGQGRLDVMGSGGKVTLAPTVPLTQTGGMVINGTVVLDFSNMTDPTNMLFTGIPGNKSTGAGSGFVQFGGGTGNIARTVQQNSTLIIKGKPGAVSTYQQLGATGMVGSGANVTTTNGMGSLLVDPNGGADTTVFIAFGGIGNGGSSFMIGKTAGAGSGNVYFQSGTTSAGGWGGYGGDWGKIFYTTDGGTTVDFVAPTFYSGTGPGNLYPLGSNGTSYTPMTTNTGGSYSLLTGASSSFDTSINPAGTLTRTAGLNQQPGVKIQDVNNGQILDMNGKDLGDGVSGWLMTGDATHTGTFSVLNGHAGGSGTKPGLVLSQFALSQDLVWGVWLDSDKLIKNGGGRVILQNTVASTYPNGTFINDGILQVNAPQTLTPFGTGSIRFSGGTLQYGLLNLAYDYSGSFNTAGNEPIKIDTNGQNVNFATSIKGAVTTLTKLGAGTLTLTASVPATYTGATTVSGGTLNVASTTDINTSSGVNIGAGNFSYNSATALLKPITFTSTGGTLSGTGTITPKVAVTSGNNLSPGDGVGTLNLSSGLTLAAGGIFDWQNNTANLYGTASTNWSVANVTGSTTISSTASSGSKLKLRFTDAGTSFSHSFWDTAQTWSFITGGVSAGNMIDTSNISVFVNAAPVGAGNTISGQGAFSTAVAGSNLELVWTPSVGGAGNNSQILISTSPDSSSISTGTSAKTIAFSRVLVGSTQTTASQSLANSGSDGAPFTVTAAGDVASSTFASGTLASTNSSSGTLTLSTATTGSKSGTLTIANTAADSLGAGLGSADANDVFTVTGTVVAVRAVMAPIPTALGTFHAGATVSVASNIFGCSYGTGGTGAHTDTEDTTVQAYASGTDGNGITLTGGPETVSSATGFTRSFTGTAVVNTSGGSFTSTVNPEISSATTVNAAYSIAVYSGQMAWNGVSGSAWATGTNWSDSVSGGAQAAPGLDGSYAGVDTATFGATSGSVTVNLDSSAPSVNALTFTGTGSYELAQGSGSNSITLAGTAPAITSAGTQAISTPLILANNTAVAVTSGTLAISGIISGSGMSLAKSGAGTLTLSAPNTYDGGTSISGTGTLLVNNSSGSGTVTVGAGSTLGGTGVIVGAVNVTGILSPGGSSLESLASGPLTLNSASHFVYQAASSTSTGADLMVVSGALSLTAVTLDLTGLDGA
ncbi:MAG: autotransporter-associated beta strand repeat-containing protein [Verrucomicrobiota bacterium]